jgi:hypothetical protein
MPFKPNYRQQRNDRDRAKERKAEEKKRRKEEEAAARRGPGEEAAPDGAPSATEPSSSAL